MLYVPHEGDTCFYFATQSSRARGSAIHPAAVLAKLKLSTPNIRLAAREATAAGILALRAAGANQLLRPASTTPRSYGRRHRSWHVYFKHAATRQPRRKPTVETCVDTTAKLRPQASVLALRAASANQPLRPASTTPRSYGRRHRSWHHGHVHATHNERCRGKRPAHHDQVHAWRLGHRHGHHNHSPAMHNERRRVKRPGRNEEVPATHNERRREQWHEHHHDPP